MYDLDIGLSKKEMVICILIVFAVLAGVFFSGYLFGIRNTGRTDGGGENNGSELVGQQIGSAVANQREIDERIQYAESGVTEIAGSIEKSAGGITAAAESVGRSENLVAESNQLIGECKSILAEIRGRGKGKAPKD